MDPDFNMQIQIQAILVDRAWNSDKFTFLKFENLPTSSKVISHQSWALFVQKNKILADYIFKDKSNIVIKIL